MGAPCLEAAPCVCSRLNPTTTYAESHQCYLGRRGQREESFVKQTVSHEAEASPCTGCTCSVSAYDSSVAASGRKALAASHSRLTRSRHSTSRSVWYYGCVAAALLVLCFPHPSCAQSEDGPGSSTLPPSDPDDIHPYITSVAPGSNVTTAGLSAVHQNSTATAIRWAEAAYQYIRNLNCSQVLFTTHRECTRLTHLRRQKINVYAALPSELGRFQAMLPEGRLIPGSHNGVVVLDPYPGVSFGHFLLVFFVNLGWPRSFCEQKGWYLEESGECFIHGLRAKCINSINRYRSRGGAANSRDSDDMSTRQRKRERRFAKKCEVHFLPTVKFEASSTAEAENLLRCHNNIPHYADCPLMRQANETSGVMCDPLQLNHGRCETTHFLSGLDTCSRYTRCDHAVMIGGGWNSLTSLEQQKSTFLEMYNFFRSNGFDRRKISPFFGNGLPQGIPPDPNFNDGSHEGAVPVYPAALKMAISSRIRHLCSEPYCVETLVIYLSTPATIEGDMLLWDVNEDGVADDSERYTMQELLRDTENCNAISVHIIADQSFSGKLAKTIRREGSVTHSNALVFASSRETEYSFENEFTYHWMSLDHTHSCSRNIFQYIRDHRLMESTPEMQGDTDLTIFGAQCNVNPPFSEDDLNLYHRGCQYVPLIVGQSRSAARRKKRAAGVVPSTSESVRRRRRAVEKDSGEILNGRMPLKSQSKFRVKRRKS